MKAIKFGTFIKVKYLILLNIFSVIPTHVGMFLACSQPLPSLRSLPHACRDVPVPVPLRLSCRR